MKGEEEVQKYRRIPSFFQHIFSQFELVIRKNILFINAEPNHHFSILQNLSFFFFIKNHIQSKISLISNHRFKLLFLFYRNKYHTHKYHIHSSKPKLSLISKIFLYHR